MVLDIGHFIGHTFKPWEATKWTKGINAAGQVLGTFGVVLSIGIQAKEDLDADKREQKMRNSRETLRAEFNNALVSFLSKNYRTRITEIDAQVSEIGNMRLVKSQTCKLLESAQTDCLQLISDIHESYS